MKKKIGLFLRGIAAVRHFTTLVVMAVAVYYLLSMPLRSLRQFPQNWLTIIGFVLVLELVYRIWQNKKRSWQERRQEQRRFADSKKDPWDM